MATKDITDRQVCEACRDFHSDMGRFDDATPFSDQLNILRDKLQRRLRGQPVEFTPTGFELLIQRTGQPWKVCYRAMERAENRGLIESGVSLRTAWLTEKGKALLSEEVVDGEAEAQTGRTTRN